VSVVREVLFELASVGLLRAEENLGFFVDKLDIGKLVEAWQVRAVLDGLAARLCCRRASRQDIAELLEMVERCYQLCCSDNEEHVQQGIRLDRQLHERIVETAGNESLSRAKRSFWMPMVGGDEMPSARREATHLEHKRIIEAIEQDQPDEAERLMREHICNGQRYILEFVETGIADLKWYL
jgi:DNA-binding GntR family transcriptional regulator